MPNIFLWLYLTIYSAAIVAGSFFSGDPFLILYGIFFLIVIVMILSVEFTPAPPDNTDDENDEAKRGKDDGTVG